MGDLSEDINSKFPNNKVKALLNIIYTANWIKNKQAVYFKPFDISSQQFNILKILKGATKPLKVQTVKARMLERSPNTTRLMDKLCDKNLINRIACSTDRRVVHIEITKKGLMLLNKIEKDKMLNLMENLTQDDAKTLSDLLDKIR